MENATIVMITMMKIINIMMMIVIIMIIIIIIMMIIIIIMMMIIIIMMMTIINIMIHDDDGVASFLIEMQPQQKSKVKIMLFSAIVHFPFL